MLIRGVGRARASLAWGSHRDNGWGWSLWEMLCSPGATRWVETGAFLSMQYLGGQWVGWRLSALLNPLARWVGLKPPRRYAHWELIGLAGAFQYVVCTKAMGKVSGENSTVSHTFTPAYVKRQFFSDYVQEFSLYLWFSEVWMWPL